MRARAAMRAAACDSCIRTPLCQLQPATKGTAPRELDSCVLLHTYFHLSISPLIEGDSRLEAARRAARGRLETSASPREPASEPGIFVYLCVRGPVSRVL